MGALYSTDLAVFGALTAGFGALAVWQFRKMLRISADKRKFLDCKVILPSELIKDLENEKKLSKWQPCPDLPDEFKAYYIIKGTVESSHPLNSLINDERRAVYLKHFQRTIFSNHRSLDAISTRVVPYFFLKDSNNSCMIHSSEGMKVVSDLQLIAAAKRMKNLTFLDKVLVFIGGIGSIFGFRGFKIGVTEGEIGISVGSTLMAYGEVIYNTVTKDLRMDHPLFLFFKKNDLTQKYERHLFRYIANTLICSVAFGICVATVKNIIDRNRRIRDFYNPYKTDSNGDRRANHALADVRNLMINDYQCKVCESNPRNVIFKPCLHFCSCGTCYNTRKITHCPECNGEISEKVEVFFV